MEDAPPADFRVTLFGTVLLVFLVASVALAVTVGPVSISLSDALRTVLVQIPGVSLGSIAEVSASSQQIIWNLRFPRVLLAVLVGAGLSVVGVALQALVRNPLADPYILGISSGASTGAALVIVLGVLSFLGSWALSVAACIGAFITLIVVFVVAREGGRIPVVRLLLAGIAMSAILSALTSFILFLAPRSGGVAEVYFWIMGGLGGASWNTLPIPAVVVVLGTAGLFYRSRSLNLMLMGDEVATTLGLNVNRFRKILLIVTTLMTGVLVSVSGVIGFVGLIMPHLVRMFVGASHRRLIPLSALCGAIFLVWVDVLARTMMAPEEIPIGIITALAGGPFFIWLMRRQDYGFGVEGQ